MTVRSETIDISVELAPAKRTIYTGGPFFGTTDFRLPDLGFASSSGWLL